MKLFDNELQQLLDEDTPYGDLTTRVLGFGEEMAVMRILCRRESMVVSCIDEAARMCELTGLHIKMKIPEGTKLQKGELLLEVHGSAKAVHQAWKVTQNLLDVASGIATYTREMVDSAREVNENIVVATTRKTPPFAKKVAIKAVEAGGGVAHRLGLSESLLMFEEHRCFFKDDEALSKAILHVKQYNPEKHLVVEVHSLEEARRFAIMGADILQLEKFPLEDLKDAITTLRSEFLHVKLIATGGIKVDNVREYAQCGADIIVTSAPYNAPSADVKVVIAPL